MTETTQLDPTETAAGHPFTSIENYHSDIALLNYLLQDLRVLVRRAAKGEMTLTAQQVLMWEVHGLARRTVVCDPEGLAESDTVQIVGFFGQSRDMVTRIAVDSSELGLIDAFVDHPGILSYSSIELVNNYWANLVVHRDAGDREVWRSNAAHVRAVNDVAPAAYHSVRIHNGCIQGGVPGTHTVVIETTKYWDYDTDPVWAAERSLPGGETAALIGPISEVDHLATEPTTPGAPRA